MTSTVREASIRNFGHTENVNLGQTRELEEAQRKRKMSKS